MPGIRMSRPSAVAVMVLTVALVIAPALAQAGTAPPQKTRRKPVPPVTVTLDTLLAKTAEYCRRLESSAFDFVCREEISETIDPKLDAAVTTAQKNALVDAGSTNYLGVGASNYIGPTLTFSTVRKIKRSVVYDYQCIRAGRTIREARTQLEENGKRKVVPNADLQTSIVVWATSLLAPVGLFGDRFQPGYDFTISGNDLIGKTAVVIIDAKPKPGAPPTRNLYGKAWVDPATGNILKIEWSESRVGRREIFEKRGELFKRTPRLVIRSEFSAEKNGIRFPSHLYVEEAYLKANGKAFIRSKTEVVYKDFKFFSVQYEYRD